MGDRGSWACSGSWSSGEVLQRSMSQAPAAAETQVWMRTPSPGAAVVTSPLRRSRTAPSRSGTTQPKQMPIRQPGRHQDAGGLAGVEQRRAAVGVDGGAAAGEGDGAAVARGAQRPAGSARCAGDRPGRGRRTCSSTASSSPSGPQAQVSRSREVGHELEQLRPVEPAVGRRCAARRAGFGRGRRASAARRRTRRRRRARRVHDHDVVEVVERCAQHAHHRRDAAARGDEQHLGGCDRRQDEVAGGLVELHDGADGGAAHEVVAHDAVGHGLDRDRDAAVGAVGGPGQRVGAPLAYAVDVDADPDVLARAVPAPAAAGPDDDGDGVAGLGLQRDDATAQRRRSTRAGRCGRGSPAAGAAS